MERILLSICAVVVAVGLGGASAPQGGAGNQEPQAQLAQQQAPPPSPLPERERANPLEIACSKSEDNRSSNLCAQWKAADSAYEAAIWTRRTGIFTGIGLVVGFFTLGAAVAAARFASDAVKLERQAAIMRRPLIYCQAMKSSVKFEPPAPDGSRCEVEAIVQITNFGTSPGLLKSVSVSIVCAPITKVLEQIKHRAEGHQAHLKEALKDAPAHVRENFGRAWGIDQPEQVKPTFIRVMAPGDGVQEGQNASFTIGPEDRGIVTGSGDLILEARIGYQDFSGNQWERVTRWRWEVIAAEFAEIESTERQTRTVHQ